MVTERTAFPGAVGYGRSTIGGRGGRVFHITSLADATPAPPGSLRQVIEASGPRIGVFDVAGTIELVRQLTVTNPYLTLAGQTAPGEGVCIKSGLTNMDATFSPRCDEVIVSNLKFRPGIGGTSVSGGRTGDAVDCIGNRPSGMKVRNHYYRHCSCSWPVDEAIDLCGVSEVTVDSCLLSEPLNLSTHSYTKAGPRIGHSKALIASYPGSGNVTLYRTVSAHTMDRQPAEISVEFGTVDVINCGCYDWGTDLAAGGGRQWILHFSNQFGNYALNVAGNWFKPGPESVVRKHFWYGHPQGSVGHQVTLYLAGNVDSAAGLVDLVYHQYPDRTTLTYADAPLGDAAYGNALPAWAAYDLSVKEGRCGDSYRLNDLGQRVMRTDPVDRRILQEIAEGSGLIINDPSEVGGWPTLDPGQPLDWGPGDVPKAYAEHYPEADLSDFLWR